MSIKNKFQNWFYLDDEEEIATNEQPKPKPTPQEKQRPVNQQARQTGKTRNQQPRQTAGEEQQAARVVSLQSVQKSSKVILVEPRVYAEAQDISEHLKNKRAVVVNLQRIDRDQGIRIVDFLSGTVYALGGDIQRIGTDIFLCVPDNVEVAGAITDYFEQ